MSDDIPTEGCQCAEKEKKKKEMKWKRAMTAVIVRRSRHSSLIPPLSPFLFVCASLYLFILPLINKLKPLVISFSLTSVSRKVSRPDDILQVATALSALTGFKENPNSL